jgi:PAS domain S-box-containing protein
MGTPDYKALFNSSTELLLIIDADLIIISATQAYLKAINKLNEDIADKNIFEVFTNEANETVAGSVDDIRASLNRVLQNKTTDTLNIPVYTTNNPEVDVKLKCYLLTHSPTLDESGDVKYITQRLEDVTEIEILKVRLEQKTKSLAHIAASEKRYYMMLMKSPFAFSIMKGEDLVVTLANDLMKDFWGKGKNVEGKTLLQVLPELEDQPFPAMILSVLKTGAPVYANEILARLKHHDKMEDRYFNIVYQPYYEEDGTISGVTTIAYEVTEMVLARKKIEESEHRYQEMIFSSPSLIAILKGEEMIIDVANDAILETWGKGKNVVGKPLLTALPELVGHGFDDLFNQVYTTGQPHYAYEMPVYLVRNGQKELSYYTFIYQAQRDTGGNINGVAVIGREVTPEAQLNQKIKESEEQFRRLVMQAPVAICVLRGEDYVIETINEPMIEIWDRTMEEAIDRPVFDVLTELSDQGLKQLLDQVYTTGQNVVINELPLSIKRNGALTEIFVKFVYEPLREIDGTISGVMALAHEITDQVLARKKMEAQALMQHDMLMTAPGFVCTLVGPTHVYTLVNEQYQLLFGKREIKGKPIMVALPELEGQGFDKLLDKVYTTGETYVGFDIPVILARDENLAPELRYFNFSYQPMYDENKEIYSILVFGYEVTEIAIAKNKN